ncbi:MAG: hypothetical protein JJ896_14830 [Rhodothermales bacterium]|nr:hypothetical protein [Rhodothermales bacterium]MBO6780926.1 hypothetical protein [Rhodothermales bacterium]
MRLLLLLVRQQLRFRLRSFKVRGNMASTLVLGFFGAYIAFTLFTLGAFLPVFTEQMAPGTPARALVDRHALSTLIGLFFLRFLLQKTPKVHVESYLHLPVPRNLLVAFFSGSTVFSVHNVFPLLFAVPFAVRFLAPVDGVWGAVQWTGAIVTLLLVSNFANIYVRTQLNRREGVFLAALGVLLTVALADEYLGAGVLGRASTILFTEVHRPSWLLVTSMAGVVVGSAMLASGALLEALRREDPAVVPSQTPGRLHEMAERWDLAGHLIWLELRLMWRNRRPRHYLIVSLMFSTIYLVFLLGTPGVFDGAALGAVIGLFASGGFVLNYGQLMFSWDSSHMEGLMARSVQIRAMTRAKMIVLQASCLLLFVVSLPVFLWLQPDLIPLHVAFLFYNAGITSQVILELATRNRERVDLGRSGGFFNYEGFSAKHWLWFLPTAMPPAVLLLVLRDSPQVAWTVLAGLGLLGLLTSEFWTRRHAGRVERRKHTMLAGFAVRA